MEATQSKAMETPSHLRGLKLGPPTIRVRRVDPILRFYEKEMGLRPKRRSSSRDGLELIELGFNQTPSPLLILKHDPEAIQPPDDFAGLYHYAVLLPTRKDLASTYLAAGKAGVLYDGYADHSFSEAIYLHDPEQNGIELYADRPRAAWPMGNGRLGWSRDFSRFASLNRPLDIDSLLRELRGEERANPIAFPNAARIGHMHLRVTDLARSVEFYRSKFGFDLTMYFPEIGAAFMSVDGYHHHLGLNTWHSGGGTHHAVGEMGLEEFGIALPREADVEGVSKKFPESKLRDGTLTVTDPDGILIKLSS